MIKVKEYPPVISIKTIMDDQLLGAKSYPTVLKRLQVLKIKILAYDMVNTLDLFNALNPVEEIQPEINTPRRTKPFKIRR